MDAVRGAGGAEVARGAAGDSRLAAGAGGGPGCVAAGHWRWGDDGYHGIRGFGLQAWNKICAGADNASGPGRCFNRRQDRSELPRVQECDRDVRLSGGGDSRSPGAGKSAG